MCQSVKGSKSSLDIEQSRGSHLQEFLPGGLCVSSVTEGILGSNAWSMQPREGQDCLPRKARSSWRMGWCELGARTKLQVQTTELMVAFLCLTPRSTQAFLQMNTGKCLQRPVGRCRAIDLSRVPVYLRPALLPSGVPSLVGLCPCN